MSGKNPNVDAYMSNATKWRKELEKLRKIILDCGLIEEYKWQQPCYTFQKKNLLILHGMKESCALAFFTGSLLKDTHHLLTKQGENTQAGRWIKFTSLGDIVKREPILKAYIKEAIAAEKAGLKVSLNKNAELVFPQEFQTRLEKNPALKTAFFALTPGRRRAYNIFFTAPKQSKTRETRVEKCIPQILKGRGLLDR